jgi:divalent metal cation (Fe/Co/Zn/Cd) transporter
MLTGHTARPDFMKKITWLALNHHPSIHLIDTVRAFHFGQNFLVEVDIVLPEDMDLKTSHDIGESLQVGAALATQQHCKVFVCLSIISLINAIHIFR